MIGNPRISIVGAGPGGLTCARILQKHGISVTVYDRDAGPQARDQGGSLDLSPEDGQLALSEAGLIDAFFALARPEGQEMRQIDPQGRLLSRRAPEPDELYKPEIDRGRLRDLLLGSLEPETVQWGRSLDSVAGPSDGPRELRFSDGTVVETDLVIGADGASSRVRPAVSSAVARYSGMSFLEAWFDDVDTRHPGLAELTGPGLAAAADGERALFAQRNGGNQVRVYIIQQVPVDWIARAGLTIADTPGLRAHLLEQYAGWAPVMRSMITDNDGPYVDRPIFVLPADHSWEHSPSVTLLGDAAHLIPPIGVGVNLAMLDACELALALAGSATVDDAVRRYEKPMLERSIELARTVEQLGGAAGMIEVDDEEAAEFRSAP
jgi:2-polyprenyl-6-methoxyphenol hydroxylase-like FAD-dependent oxidoreductase